MGVRIRQKDGKWYVFINHQGRRKAKCVGDSKRAAEEVKRKLEAKLALGDMGLLDPAPSVPTVGAYAEQWLRTYAKLHCKESTYIRYAGVMRNHVVPMLGDVPLTALTREDVKRLIYHKRETDHLTPASVQQVLAPLREMLNYAVEDGTLGSNPAARIGRFLQRRHVRKQAIRPLSREELATFLASVEQHAPEHYPLFLCLARTGMRLGEALALQWGDIDFRGRFVEIQRNYSLGKITSPKNGHSRRVDMSQQLADTLQRLHTQRKEDTLRWGWQEVPVWVFCTQEGGCLDPSNLRKRVFHRCLTKAGLRHIRMHDLRHTYASLLIQQNESLAYIKDQLGHHSIQVTVDIYGHLVPGGNQTAVDRLDDAPKCNLGATDQGIRSRESL